MNIDISPETMGVILLISWTVMSGIGIVRLVIWWRARKNTVDLGTPATSNSK